MLNLTGKLKGYLVGLGIEHKDGSVDFKWLDKPIGNRITSGGLDHLLRYNGSNTAQYNSASGNGGGIPFWTNDPGCCSNKPHIGVLHFCCLGRSGDVTSFNDTELKDKVTDYYPYTSNDLVYNGNPFKGTKHLGDGKVKMRITHKHYTVTEDTTISEIGWFGSYGSTNNAMATPVMFSRVVLDQPVSLLSGERLITTYELQMNWNSSSEISHLSSFAGLTDSTGETLQCDTRIGFITTATTTFDNDSSPSKWMCIVRGSTSSALWDLNYSPTNGWMPPWSYYTGTTSPGYDDVYYTTSDVSLSTVNVSNYKRVPDTTGTHSYKIDEYTCVDKNYKYRDIEFTMGIMCPNISDVDGYVDIKGLLIRGNAFRFGYNDADGNWVSQSLRKFAQQELTLIHRTQFVTDDTEDIPEGE